MAGGSHFAVRTCYSSSSFLSLNHVVVVAAVAAAVLTAEKSVTFYTLILWLRN